MNTINFCIFITCKMIKYFQNIALLLLLVAIMAPLSFAFLSYRVQLKLVKREVKQQLIQETDQADLVAFSFDLHSNEFKGITWEHGHEFELKGKMYDIVEADTVGNEVHYLCFPDKQETALNLAFKEKLKNRYAQDGAVRNRGNQMLLLIYGLYFIPFQQDNQNYTLITNRRYAAYRFNYQSIGLDLASPPPQKLI